MRTMISVVIDREDGSDLVFYSTEATSTDLAITLVREWIEARKTMIEGEAG